MTEPFLPESPEWMVQALCAQTDPEVFYPEKGESPRTAKSICARCEVSEECLIWALETREPHGVWGGATPRERINIRRRADQSRWIVGQMDSLLAGLRQECPNGHAYTATNTYVNPSNGRRQCRQCMADRQQRIRDQAAEVHRAA